MRATGFLALPFVVLAVVPVAHAQLALSANDSKVMLVNGVTKVIANPPSDTVAIIDLGATPPKLVAEVAVPASGVGPPLSVALTPDERLALVTANQKVDPADPTGQTADNRLSVIDLKASPPAVIAKLETGKAPADRECVTYTTVNGSNKPKESPFYSDNGNLVLVRVTSTKFTRVAEAPIGHWSQGVTFSADGKTIVAGNMVEKDPWIFEWNGSVLRDTGHRIKLSGGSAALRTAEK
jgi:hypothetical protein